MQQTVPKDSLAMAANIMEGENFPEAQTLADESFDEEEFKDVAEIEETIKGFWKANSLKQRRYVKNLTLMLEKLGIERLPFVVSNLYPANRALMEANHEVALLLTESIAILLKSMDNNPSLRADEQAVYRIEATFVDFLKELIESAEQKLLAASRRTLVTISRRLSKRCCDNNLLTAVLTLLHDPQSDINRLSALELITKLHSLFSRQYIEGFVAMDILAMMQDSSLRVRIEAYQTFFALFSSFESEFVEKRFLDVLEAMSNDPNTDIKLIFIRNVPLIGRKLSFKKFEFKILSKFMDHLASKDRFYREEALTNIGELIVALIGTQDSLSLQEVHQSPVFDRIFESFFDLPKIIAKMNLSVKKNIIKANYPLLRRIVAARKSGVWPRVKKLIIGTEELDASVIELAKLEIASQLDAIAQVTGKVALEKELIQLIDRFYLTVSSTTSEKVKQNTIKVLAGVLQELGPEAREKYADVYQMTMTQDMRKWRLRWVISEQIDNLSKLFSPATVVSKILPMYFSFCKDNCAVVRKYASKNFWRLLINVHGDADGLSIALISMKSFGNYNRFVLRQSFVLMLEGVLVNSPSYVDADMIEILKQLAVDKVVNIRIAVARLLRTIQNGSQLPEWFDEVAGLLVASADEDLYTMLNGHLRTPALQNTLDAAIKARYESAQKKIQDERSRVDELRRSKGLLPLTFERRGSESNLSVGQKSRGQTYRDVLREAFELKSDDEDVKQLMADLNIELDKKSTGKPGEKETTSTQENEEEAPRLAVRSDGEGRRRSNNIIDLRSEIRSAMQDIGEPGSPIQVAPNDAAELAEDYREGLIDLTLKNIQSHQDKISN